jgi:hypothetical protein
MCNSLDAQSLHLEDQVVHWSATDLWLRELGKLVLEHGRRVESVSDYETEEGPVREVM